MFAAGLLFMMMLAGFGMGLSCISFGGFGGLETGKRELKNGKGKGMGDGKMGRWEDGKGVDGR